MEFNLVSKNNLGAATAMLLVIILSQGRFFNFLLDTALGRAILIIFILFISYTNKILGVVSVLFIIIMFNNSNIGYMEGATTMGSSMDTNMGSMKKDDKKTDATGATTTGTGAGAAGAAGTTGAAGAAGAMKKSVEGGAEGSNLLETERGSFNKKSSSIPATKTTSAEGFEPFSGYSQNYSQF